MGYNAVVTANVRVIGRGSIIGAGTVVTKDVPRYSIVVGNPGYVVRSRFTGEVIEAIESCKWWERDIRELRSLVPELPFASLREDHAWLARIQSMER